MGYKTAAVFVTSSRPNYFAAAHPHQPEKAKRLLSELGLKFDEAGEILAYGQVMEPTSFKFALGAYDEGFALTHDLLYGLVVDPENELFQKILKMYPSHNILAIELYSTVNKYGYAVYDNGTLIRALGGDSEAACIVDTGELLPEEIPYFAKSHIVNGELVFLVQRGSETRQYSLSAYGEDLVFAVAGRFLGKEVAMKPDDTQGPIMQVFKEKISANMRINKAPPTLK